MGWAAKGGDGDGKGVTGNAPGAGLSTSQMNYTRCPTAPPERCRPPLLRVWASLGAGLVKNLPAVQETLIQLLGREDPLEKGKATHSSILGLPWWLSW